MEFQVPQFIEHKPKVVGPFTFGQFIYIGAAGGICFFLWFSLGKTNFFLFVFISVILFLTAGILAFGKMGGRSLPLMIGNFLKFSLMPKRYLWKTKEMPPKIIMRKAEPKKEEKIEEIPLKIGEKSQLKKLSIKIETRMR